MKTLAAGIVWQLKWCKPDRGVPNKGYESERNTMTSRPSGSSKGSAQQGYKVWHFALAVPAIAVTLQLMLGSLTPLPKEHSHYPTHYAASFPYDSDLYNDFYLDHRLNRLPESDILPLNLRGEMTGPLLASVIKEYFPQSTPQHANDLRDTLPPCDNPRMIVILPKEDQPVF